MKRRKAVATVALLAIFALSVAADELRMLVSSVITVSSAKPDGESCTIGITEGVAISCPADDPFIKGIEIELKLPSSVSGASGTIVYALYKSVSPMPTPSRYDYSGRLVVQQTLPARAGLVLQVPVTDTSGLKTGPYATVLSVVPKKDFPLVFRLFPAVKGLPASVEAARVTVRVRPILTDEGLFVLSLKYPEGRDRKPVTVYIDDRKVELDSGILLKAGEHTVSISSEDYRDEKRTFAVISAQVTEITITLADPSPIAVFEAPTAALLYIDGVLYEDALGKPLRLAAGDHVVSCVIGDYTISRKITLFRGKTYKIVLSVGLEIQESE